MMERGVTESVVEEAALAWLESVGWQIRNGADIAPGEPAAERDDFGQIVLVQRLRETSWLRLCRDLRLKDAEKFVGRAL